MAVLAADGFEQVEVTFPVAALKRAGADVRILSLRPGRLRGMNLLWPGRKLPVDDTVFNAKPEDYGAVYLPGGFVNPDLLRQSEAARDFIRKAQALGRPIAVMCHGPELLISAGLLKGRKLTSWPGIADDVKNAGGQWENSSLVRDENWVSSRGPHDLPAFIPAMLELFEARAERATYELKARLRWVATVSRMATWGLAFFALRMLFRRRRRSRLMPLVLPVVAAAGVRYLRQQADHRPTQLEAHA